jgi:hypothetical protein
MIKECAFDKRICVTEEDIFVNRKSINKSELENVQDLVRVYCVHAFVYCFLYAHKE